jgi:hypothetical protein
MTWVVEQRRMCAGRIVKNAQQTSRKLKDVPGKILPKIGSRNFLSCDDPMTAAQTGLLLTCMRSMDKK